MKLASHNSLSFVKPKKWWEKLINFTSKCQLYDIETQYLKGVRLFDIRVRRDDSSYGAYSAKSGHGLITYDKCIIDVLYVLDSMSTKEDPVYIQLNLENRKWEEDKDFMFVSITHTADSKINIGSFYIRNNAGETEIAWFGLTDIKPFSEFSNRLLPEVDSSKHGQVLAVAEDGSWTTISVSTSSGDIVSSTDDNKIKILSDKTMEVNNITVDKLVDSGTDSIVLFGGNA